MAAVVLLPALVALGFWQLERAQQKERLLQSWSAPEIYNSIPDPTVLSVQPFIAVELVGRFDTKRFFFLDNRIRNGVVGYEVIAFFYPRQGSPLLVNLGWVSAVYDRRKLPDVLLPEGERKVTGRVRKIAPAFVLDESLIRSGEQWPYLIQILDAERMGSLLQETVLPLELKVMQPLVSSLDINWPVSTMTPEKHLGYAVQWFAMSLMLCGLLIWSWKYVQRRGLYE